jgi:hypothetical protein
MIPAKKFGGMGHAVLHRFRADVWSQQRGETEYGIKGHPAR